MFWYFLLGLTTAYIDTSCANIFQKQHIGIVVTLIGAALKPDTRSWKLDSEKATYASWKCTVAIKSCGVKQQIKCRLQNV